MNALACTLFIGIGATALMDLWTIVRKRLLDIPALDYGLVGRWLGYFARGRFRHESISASPPIRGERLLGWSAHYAIGVALAGLLLGIWGLDWGRHPTIGPALLIGFGSVAAPFLIMQPGMGAGIAGRRTPRPAVTRLQSLLTHGVFGVGLYAAGWIARLLAL